MSAIGIEIEARKLVLAWYETLDLALDCKDLERLTQMIISIKEIK